MNSKNRISLILLPLVAILFVSMSYGQSGETVWQVDQFSFESGAGASGSFRYNPTTNSFTNIDITVTGINPKFENIDPDTVSNAAFVSFIAVSNGQTVARLRLKMSIPLTNDGGYTATILEESSLESCDNGNCGSLISRPNTGFIVAARAQAGTRTWYLDNVRFDSGAVATGSFDYNVEPNNPAAQQYGTFSRINIDVTSPDGTVRKFRIVNPNSGGHARYISLVAAEGGDLTGAPYMALTPEFAMTNEGGVIDILPGPQDVSYLGVCQQANCGPADGPYEQALEGGRIISGPRRWHLDNVQFHTGAKATGFFEYDMEPYNPSARQYGTYRNIYVDVINPDSSIRKFRQVNPDSGGNSRYVSLVAGFFTESNDVLSIEPGDLTGRPYMALTPKEHMTNEGDTIDILPGPQDLSYLGVCEQANCGPADGPYEEALRGGRIISKPARQRWYLEGIRFDSGARATGYFDFNPMPLDPSARKYGRYSNININVTSLDATVRKFRVVNPDSGGNERYISLVALTDAQQQLLIQAQAADTTPENDSPDDILTYLEDIDLTGNPYMALTPEFKMNNVNGPINILPGPQDLSYLGICEQASCGPADGPYEEAIAGGRIVRELVAPSITSVDSIGVPENQTTAIDINTADNLDTEANGLVYSINGGVDSALFNIDIITGVLSFIDTPDFESPLDDDTNNVYQLQVMVTDLGGLIDVQDIKISVTDELEDITAPIANPVFDPAAPNGAGWYNDDVTITWNWSDEPGGSGLDPDNCEISFTFNFEGSQATVGQCTDLAGNLGFKGSGSIQIDKTPPETTITSMPPATSYTGEVTFSFSGSDALSGVSGFECDINNGSFGLGGTCTSPHTITDLADGTYTISVYAIDLAGNPDPTPASFELIVDSCPTDLNLSSPTNDFSAGSHVKQAGESISASNKILGSTELVTYKAGTKIIMTAGFVVEAGAQFHAHIEVCGDE